MNKPCLQLKLVLQCNPLLISEEELEAERRKLYEAIGYSEKGKAAAYPKEVHTCTYMCMLLFKHKRLCILATRTFVMR